MKGYKLLETAEDISVASSKKARRTYLNISIQTNGGLICMVPNTWERNLAQETISWVKSGSSECQPLHHITLSKLH